MNVIDIWNSVRESGVLQSVIIFILAVLCDRLIIQRATRMILDKSIEKNKEMEAKFRTLFSVIRTSVSFVIYFIAVIFMIQILFNTSASSVIAATGIIGVIVGLGMQSIVKDSLSGFFILLENQYKVGDLVTVDNFMGTVESVTIRTTIIKGFEGDRLIIPNGNMKEIINHNLSDKSIIVDVNISYNESIERAAAVIVQTLRAAENEIFELTGKIEYLGVNNLGEFAVTLRMMAHCTTGSQYAVKRELLKRIKEAFDANGIKMPFQN